MGVADRLREVQSKDSKSRKQGNMEDEGPGLCARIYARSQGTCEMTSASFADIAFERSLDDSGEHFSLDTLGRPKQSKVNMRAPSIFSSRRLIVH